jgi:transposase InsO family protein
MPWKVNPVSDLRAAFVQLVTTLDYPVSSACREFAISRKTGYKWLRRARQAPGQALLDRSRRPRSSPSKTAALIEQQVLQLHDRYRWGARKLHALLRQDGVAVPSVRSVHNVLRRHGRVCAPAPPAPPPQSFVHPEPNDLWQLDFKGPVEVARRHIAPLTVLDDHSRFLFAVRPCGDISFATAWAILWEAFGEFGLPRSLLCDNFFSTKGHAGLGLSWFDARLLRLGVRPVHGRPYHPQTQGKVERLHGTLVRELWPTIRRDTLEHFEHDLRAWRHVYNTLRPHEALQDRPPLSCWRPSPRRRPPQLPEVVYPAGALLRKVGRVGDVCWRGYRILVGQGLAGEHVRIEEKDQDVVLYYAEHRLRCLPVQHLQRGPLL